MRLDLPTGTLASIDKAKSLAADGDLEAARATYEALLRSVADDDYQAAAVAHMYAIVVTDPVERLAINEEALERAQRSPCFPPPMVATLHANLGYSHMELGHLVLARNCYLSAQEAAAGLDDDQYGEMIRAGIRHQLQALDRQSQVGAEAPRRKGSSAGSA